MKNNYQTAQSVIKRIHMSPTKLRRVIKLIKNGSYEDTLILLEFLPYKACYPIWRVLQSAVANILYKDSTINKKNLYIKEIFVNKGPILKRIRPRAKGRTFFIKKQLCHITIIIININ